MIAVSVSARVFDAEALAASWSLILTSRLSVTVS